MTATETAGVLLMPFAAVLIFLAERAKVRIMDDSPKTKRLWRDTSHRFPDDDLLRRRGYEIYQRGNGDPVWRFKFCDGTYSKPTPQKEILDAIRAAEKDMP